METSVCEPVTPFGAFTLPRHSTANTTRSIAPSGIASATHAISTSHWHAQGSILFSPPLLPLANTQQRQAPCPPLSPCSCWRPASSEHEQRRLQGAPCLSLSPPPSRSPVDLPRHSLCAASRRSTCLAPGRLLPRRCLQPRPTALLLVRPGGWSSGRQDTQRAGKSICPFSCVLTGACSSLGAVNLKPVVPGHVLVSPKRVVARFAELAPEEVADLWCACSTPCSWLTAAAPGAPLADSASMVLPPRLAGTTVSHAASVPAGAWPSAWAPPSSLTSAPSR